MTTATETIDSSTAAGTRMIRLALLAIACQLPFVAVYFVNLSRFSHYEFFPIILLAFGWLLRSRWSGEVHSAGWRRRLGWLLLVVSLVASATALAFMSSWIAYFATLLSAAVVFGSVRDRESGRSLLYLWVLLAVLWQPPYSSKQTGDVILTSVMQRISTRQVSMLLDWFQVPHVNQGTVISISGLEMGVEEACSGIQSLFLYVAIAALCSVYFQRGWIHLLVLLGSALLWALVTNTLRIFTIAIGHLGLGMDLTHGWLHDMLGYSMMVLGIALIASCDRLLEALVRQPSGVASDPGAWRPMCELWTLPSIRSVSLGDMAFASVWGLLLVGQLVDLGTLFGSDRKQVDFFAGDSLVDVDESWMPEQIGPWGLTDYHRQSRSVVSDLGQRSDVWIYRRGSEEIIVSFDQVFPGWHELTRCYEGQGWQCRQRQVVPLAGRESSGLSVVRSGMARGRDQQGLLLFALVDRSGWVLEAPGQWDLASSLYHRIRNRLSPRIRSSIFGAEAYQIQVFSSSVDVESELAEVFGTAIGRIQEKLPIAMAGGSESS